MAGGLLLGVAAPATATPFIWDEDNNRIDDRIESVNLLGYPFAFEQADTLQRLRFEVVRSAGTLVYSVYVVFDHTPTSSDELALSLLGLPVLCRYEAVPALRSAGTFVQVAAASALPGVERVEAVPVLYPLLHEAAGSIGDRDPSGQVFPTWEGTGGGNGNGIVVAFLDTGINDAPEGPWPGHESLAGRCLGGAVFLHGDSTLDTPRDGSVNPSDHGGVVTRSHGTHVASIAVGSGGAAGYAIGVAPGARFVDVKVLNDAGVGTGVADGLDWCIHNRARAWGGPAGFEGIDVINLSLSSPDQTDGNDLVSRLVNKAADLGIVVVASAGNDGESGFVPSPAGADRALAVGAFDHQRTPISADDGFASFSDYGPRASDGDGDALDELKPDLLAPGVAILAADGDESTDGAQYQRLSGTSMAAAFVTGAVAALRSSYPGLTPAQIAELFRATGRRQLGGIPAGQGGADPRWDSPIGFGAIDLYAARLEMEQPGRSQVARFELSAGLTQITARLATQREMGAAHFVFERAPDVAGQPGTFAPYDSVAAAGSSSLAGAVDRTLYARTWTVPPAERGTPFWYRISYSEGGVRYNTGARRFVSPTGPSIATVEVTIVHNAYDQDVAAEITAGGSSPAPGAGNGSSSAGLVIPVPGSSAAASSEWVTGTSTTGNVAWTFRIEVPPGIAESFLPPTTVTPWRLRVTEGGYLNRSGRVTAFRLTWHRPDGVDDVFDGAPLPQQTVEGQTSIVEIAADPTGVPPATSDLSVRLGPNPVRSGQEVIVWSTRAEEADLRVFDAAGRAIARVPFIRAEGGWRARWQTRDPHGNPLPAGVYFARAARTAGFRVLVLRY